MRKNRWLRYVLLAVLVGIPMSVAFNLLFPVILNSRILFGCLVALLFVGGIVATVVAVREVFRR